MAESKRKSILILVPLVIALAVLLLFVFRQNIIHGALGEIGYYAHAEAKTVSAFLKSTEPEALTDEEPFTADSVCSVDFDEAELYSAKLSGRFEFKQKAVAADLFVKERENEEVLYKLNVADGRVEVNKQDEQVFAAAKAQKASDLRPLLKAIKRFERRQLKQKITRQKTDYYGKSAKIVSLELTRGEAYALAADLLEQVDGNEKAKSSLLQLLESNYSLYEYLMNYLGEDCEPGAEETLSRLNEYAAGLRERAKTDENCDEVLTAKITYGKGGKILEREFGCDSESVTVTTEITKTKGDLSCAFKTDGATDRLFTLTSARADGKLNAELRFTEGDSELFFLSADITAESSNGVTVPAGNIKFRLPEKEIEGTAVTDTKNNYALELTVLSEGEEFITAYANTVLTQERY